MNRRKRDQVKNKTLYVLLINDGEGWWDVDESTDAARLMQAAKALNDLGHRSTIQAIGTVAEAEARRYAGYADGFDCDIIDLIDKLDATDARIEAEAVEKATPKKPRPVENLSGQAKAIRAIKNRRGLIIHRGPSPIDGAPIMVALQWGSGNSKTGACRQTYILREDLSPSEVMAARLDLSICGYCPHRPVTVSVVLPNGKTQKKTQRSCYVDNRSLTGVWASIHSLPIMCDEKNANGKKTGRRIKSKKNRDKSKDYIELAEAAAMLGVDKWAALRMLGDGEKIRLGTYGDPAMVPARVWRNLLLSAEWSAGYSHQWRYAWAAEHRAFCMASCDSAADVVEAAAGGWRTFAVIPGDGEHRAHAAALREATGDTAALCPASKEAGERVQCITCPIKCDGANDGRKVSHVVIPAHGPITATRAHENCAALN